MTEAMCEKSPCFLVKPAPYEEVEQFCGGVAAVKYKGKWGYVNKLGNIASPAIDDRLTNLKTEQSKKDHTQLSYDKLESFDGGYAEACVDGKWGLIDKKGQNTIPFAYEGIIQHKETVAFKLSALWGIMNIKGSVLVPPRYDRVFIYNANRIMVHRRGRKGIVTADGREVIPIKYDYLGNFEEGIELAGAGIRGKHGYIDRSGKVVIPFIYDEVSDFSDIGRAGVRLCGKYGVIDDEGNVIIPLEYDDVYYYNRSDAYGLMWARIGRDLILLDENGKSLLPAMNIHKFRPFCEGMSWVCFGDAELWGAVGRRQSVIRYEV